MALHSAFLGAEPTLPLGSTAPFNDVGEAPLALVGDDCPSFPSTVSGGATLEILVTILKSLRDEPSGVDLVEEPTILFRGPTF